MKTYPRKVGVCLHCKQDIIAKNQGFDKPTRKFCSKSCTRTYKNLTDNPLLKPEARAKLSASRKLTPKDNYKWSNERRIRWALSLKGENSRFWRGGLTDASAEVRNSVQYQLWREQVFERDNHTCQFCLKRGGYLAADHIKPFALHIELRFNVDNGRTLCKECHLKTDTFGFRTGKKVLAMK